MASVHHLYRKAHVFYKQLANEYRNLELPGKRRYYAALTIQRVYRGYKVRAMIKYWHEMATKIQKWVRGWLVRWHLPEYYGEYTLRLTDRWYHDMATKIQAAWRGYLVRRHMPQSMKEVARNRKLMEAANANITSKMREMFARMKQHEGLGGLDEEGRKKLGDECRQWVLYILFKTHHLLRTECTEGVYSDHGESKKSQIEEWMSKLPIQKYMDDLRTIYNKEFANNEKPITYIFKDRRDRKSEDAFRKRDRSHDLKPVPLQIEEDIHDKPFDILNRPIHYPYISTMACQDKYGTKSFIMRQSKKYSIESDFNLDVHHLAEVKQSPPAYYIDTWMKKCTLHYPEDN